MDLNWCEDTTVKRPSNEFGGIVAVIPGKNIEPMDIEDMIGDMIQDTLNERKNSSIQKKVPMITSDYEIVDVITLGTD